MPMPAEPSRLSELLNPLGYIEFRCLITYYKSTKKIVNELKRLNIVFEDKDFEILQQAKGEDTWAKALIKWANIVLKDRESQ